MKLFALLLLFAFTPASELSKAREQYIDAATSERAAGAFHKNFEVVGDKDSSTLRAYKAASIVLLAKYESGIITKMKLFNRGTELLDRVIESNPSDYEARLIRFNIQDNVPWITGYTSNIKEDKKFLITNYSRQTADLKQFAKNYAAYSEGFTATEKAMFR
jgi:hypothetical protein